MSDQTTTSPVLFETIQTASGHRFGRATLNVPASLNALSLEMVDLLNPQLAAWAADPQIAAVILDAAGDKAFCAGGDVVGLVKAIRALPPGQVPPEAPAFFEREYQLDYLIHTYPKPFVCWGHGIVMGGGIGLMAGASHRVATPKTRMAMPEINIGLYPDVGGSWLLSRLPGKSGEFLALTAASINAADALFAGLADFLVPHEQHGALLQSVANASWQGEKESDGAQLSHLLEQLGQGTPVPHSPLRTHLDRINAVIGHDRLQDMAPRLSALAQDEDPWLAQAGSTFLKGSPTSAALGLELQRRAKHMSLAEVFQMELKASVGCCAHPDFPEGVRALLIDKDKSPRWTPATLAEVTPEWIEAHLK
ncbi:enoyl-CoA hydratase/isomerase family protein [Ottowia thiooxydans]|uniref:3-hydroxyisobutyryl-CoA hydrolase n=1 Tax=Ottowia thiooxydans TaxID=219182 RepID=A0ABV2Q4U9_9BURK